jgi:hypothetical protein
VPGIVQPDDWQSAGGHVVLEGAGHHARPQWRSVDFAEDQVVLPVVLPEVTPLGLLGLAVCLERPSGKLTKETSFSRGFSQRAWPLPPRR